MGSGGRGKAKLKGDIFGKSGDGFNSNKLFQINHNRATENTRRRRNFG